MATGFITRKIPWTRQPPPGVGLDPSHPLYSRLKFAVNTGQSGTNLPPDFVSGKKPVVRGAILEQVTTEAGRHMKSGSTAGSLVYGRTGLDELDSTTGLTILWRARCYDNATAKYIVESIDSGTGVGISVIDDDQYSVANGYLLLSAGSYNGRTDSNVLPANSQNFWNTGAMSHKGAATAPKFYVDGESVGVPANTDTVTASANRNTYLYSRYIGSHTDLGIDYLYAYEGVLSASEIRSIAKNPNQVFQPITQYIPVGVAAAAAAAATTGFITRKIPWTKKPHTSVGVDRSNPLTKHLVGAWYFSGSEGRMFDALGDHHLNATGLNPPTIRPNASGMSYKQTANGSNESSADHGRFATDANIAGNSPLGMADSNEITILTKCALTGSGSTYPRIVDKGTGGNGAGGYALFVALDRDTVDFTVDGVSGTSALQATATVWTADSVSRVLSVRYKESGVGSIWVDGVPQTAGAGATTFPTNTTPFSIGNWARTDTTDSRRWTGNIDYVFIFGKSLSDAEVAALEANPYQIFQPRTQIIPVGVIAGAAATSYAWDFIEQGSVSLEGAGMGGRLIQ